MLLGKRVHDKSIDTLALGATLHCLTGCAIGEITGLVIGTAFRLDTATTILISVTLAFLFGYSLSVIPLLQSRMTFLASFKTVLAADTLSIVTMEIIDNLIMAVFPGAMGAGLVNPVFWIAMYIALLAAFIAAYPVNRYLLRRGKGHALMHAHHN